MTTDTESSSSLATESSAQSLDADAFIQELLDSGAVGKCSTSIVGDGCVVVSTDSGFRYLYWTNTSVVWIRPDGLYELTTKSKTKALLPQFDSLEIVDEQSLPESVLRVVKQYRNQSE